MSSRLVHSDTSDVNERTRTRFVHQRQRQVKRSIRMICRYMYYKRFAQTLSKGKYYVRWRTTTCYVCVGLNMFHWEKQYRIVSYSLVQLRARDFPFFVDINKYLIIKCHGGNVTAAMAAAAAADATGTYNSIKLFKSNRPMCGSSEKEKWYRPHPWQLNELRINLNKLFAIIIIYLSSILPRRRRTLQFFFCCSATTQAFVCRCALCHHHHLVSAVAAYASMLNCVIAVSFVFLCVCVLDSMGCNDKSDEKDSLREMKCDEKWHANDLSCI